MRYSLAVFGLIVFTSSLQAAEMPDGIYRVVEEGRGEAVVRSTGGQVNLGARLSQDFGEISIWSLSNQNDRFRVWMKQTGVTDGRGHLAICIDNICEVVSSQGKSAGSDKLDLIADVAGREYVQTVSAALDAPVNKRTHPGYQFAIQWKPLKEQFKIGEPVMLELAITNVGKVPVHFFEGGQNRGARDNQFGFTAFSSGGFGKAVPDTGDPVNFGGLAGFRILKPGDVFRKQVDITKWFKFEQADCYQITGTYQLEFYDQDHNSRVIWEDFVAGRCAVRLVE